MQIDEKGLEAAAKVLCAEVNDKGYDDLPEVATYLERKTHVDRAFHDKQEARAVAKSAFATLSLGTSITLADGTEAVVVPGSIVGLLETLSDAASNLDDKHEDRFDIWECPAAMSITAGDLRAGRAMLSALEAK